MNLDWLVGSNWKDVWLPDTPLLEILARGTVVYLALYTLLRVVLKRQRGAVGTTDLLVIVLIADAAQNAMAGDYTSVPDGILLVAVIIGWSAVLDWLGFHFPLVQRLVFGTPLALVKDGRMLRQNMAREFITEDELMSQLRLQGLSDLSEVESVCLEGDGQVSVIRKNGGRSRHHRRGVF